MRRGTRGRITPSRRMKLDRRRITYKAGKEQLKHESETQRQSLGEKAPASATAAAPCLRAWGIARQSGNLSWLITTPRSQESARERSRAFVCAYKGLLLLAVGIVGLGYQ